ncbi:MAG: UDP-N-acetylmuramoyl-tripeptide--D-alanyl-D-alanine ligase [Anaerolineales bacterium]
MLIQADVIEALCDHRPAWAQERVTGAVVDSRQASQGCLFVAVTGERVDGHNFVHQAFDQGAKLAFIQKDLTSQFRVLDLRIKMKGKIQEVFEAPFCIRVDDTVAALQETARFWRQKLEPRVIGITGSVGKSTTKEVTAEVLNQRYRTLKNPGNLNNEIGLPLTLLSLDEGHQRAILEMGFYVPGEIAFLCDLARPQVGVVTNVGTVHAERAGSQEAIAIGKSELVQALPPSPKGVAILNYDDPLVRDMASKTEARILYYGLDSNAEMWADAVEGLGLDGIRFRLHYRGETQYLKVPLIGRHSVHTVLRAAAIGIVEGLTWQEIVDGLRSGRAQLRLVAVQSPSGALILDDTYNASPQSTFSALNLLNELEGHKIAVLGDMLELGQYEFHGHKMVGVRAAEVVDELITVGERALIIAKTARQTGLPTTAVTEFEDSEQAIAFLVNRLGKNDVVLVKGSHAIRMDRIVAALEVRE